MDKTFTISLLALAVLILMANALIVWLRHLRLQRERRRLGLSHLLSRRFSVILGVICLAYSLVFVLIETSERARTFANFQTMELYDARQMAQQVEHELRLIQSQLNALIQTPDISRNDNITRLAMRRVIKMMDGRVVRALSLASADGILRYTLPDESKIGLDISRQEHNIQILRDHKPLISDPFTALQGFTAVAVSEPILENGQFLGWASALLDFDELTKQYVSVTTTGGIARAGLMDQAGKILAHSNPRGTERDIHEVTAQNPQMHETSQRILRDEEGTVRYHYVMKRADGGEEPQDRVAAFTRIHLGNGRYWVVGVAANAADILNQFQQMRWPYLAIFILFLTMLIIATTERLRDEQRYAETLENEIAIRMDDLKRMEGRFTTFFEQCPVGLMLLDTQGNCLGVNPAFGQIFGVPQDRFYAYNLLLDRAWDATGFLPLVHGALAGQGGDFLDTAITTGGEGLFADLPQRAVEVRGALFPNFDEHGAVTNILFLCMDITGRRQAEEAQVLLGTVVEQSTEAIFIADTSGVIQYVNPAFVHLTGFMPEEVIGQRARMLVRDARGQTSFHDLVKTLAGGAAWNGHLTNRRRDGTPYEVESVISPVRNARGEVIHYVSVSRDVTLELALEAQLRQSQKMDAIGKLAGGVAHDFNNVLTAIIGNLQLAQRRGGEPVQKYLKDALVASERATEMVRQLLTFSRKSSDIRKPVSLNHLIQETARLVEKSIDRRIELGTELDAALPEVTADPNQIHQVIMNLCVNARDAIMERLEGARGREARGRRSCRITIQSLLEDVDSEYCRLHAYAHPGRFAVIAVSDEGVGMDRETLARIFEPFFTTKEMGKGTGLGLSTVYGIVKTHNGWVHVDSEPGKGSRFKVYLPASADAQAATNDSSPVMAAKALN